MAKEKFNWKSLFVNDNDETIDAVKNTSMSANTNFPKDNNNSSKFPEQTPPVTIKNSDINNSVLNTVISMYESGFESLNAPGYDFYEFFKAVKAVNSDDPTIYKMALTMAQSIDSKVTKESLLETSSYYIDEIGKVHTQYASKGNTKLNDIKSNQLKEKEKLSSEISALEKQIVELQTKISSKKIKREASDSNLINDVSSIKQKIAANDIAKTKILGAIVNVVNGIKKNL